MNDKPKPMLYGSVCSGIEAATVAWHPLGWCPAFFSENAAFPSAVLAHHYPHVPNRGDITRFEEWPDADIDVLVGGTPCQSFSVAGLRKGLADPRGQLTLTFLAIAARYRPRWLLWENVPGVLSLHGGRPFGAFLGALGELGYWWAYRIMDAQYFDLAQRRPRTFVVASSRGWASAAAVLFERESLQGHPAPSRETGKGVAMPIATRADRGGSHREVQGNNLVPALTGSGRGVQRVGESRGQDPLVIARCDTAREGSRQDWETETLIAHALNSEGCDASEDGTGRGTPLVAAPLSAGNNANSNAAGRRREDDFNLIAFSNTGGATNLSMSEDSAPPLTLRNGDPGNVQRGMAVRRLTPLECERLQGFPDGYTLIPYRGKPAKDTPRYKSLGNSMPVPVMRWLGERIELVESIA